MVTLKDLPLFFDVNDVFVKVDFDSKTDEVFGMTAGGSPYSPLKAESEGTHISKADFDEAVGRISVKRE